MEIPSRAPMPRGGVGWTGQGPFIYAPSHTTGRPFELRREILRIAPATADRFRNLGVIHLRRGRGILPFLFCDSGRVQGFAFTVFVIFV